MKTIYVFSDSHGYAENMLRILNAKTPDLMIHLGDGEYDLEKVREHFPSLPIENVRGNCDRYSTAMITLRFTYEGKRFFAAHGDTYGVKFDSTLTRLRYAALEDDADIILFGHTHTPYLDEFAGMKIMNPGSCGETRAPTYGEITIQDGVITTDVKAI